MNKQIIACLTLSKKELVRVTRIWTQTLLPSVITTTLYFLIFGAFIGSRIGSVQGISYIEFIVPGLIMMSVINTSYANVSSSVFSNKFHKSIEELLVSPIKTGGLIIGFLSGGVIRGCIVGILVTIVSMVFTPLDIQYPLLSIAMLFLTSLLFSLGGFVNAILARRFDDISIIPTFILTPLIYTGGVFYSIDFLPEFWQTVSLLNPMVYIINIFRFGFTGIIDVSLYTAIGFTLVLIGVLWSVSWRLVTIRYGTKL